MTVQRYDPKYHPYSKGMEKDDLGYWVQYSDYQSLQSEIKELKSHMMESEHSDTCMCRSCNPEFHNLKNKHK